MSESESISERELKRPSMYETMMSQPSMYERMMSQPSLYETMTQESVINRLDRTKDPNSVDESQFNTRHRKQKFDIKTNTKSHTQVLVKNGVVRKTTEDIYTHRETKRNPSRWWWPF